MFLTFHKFAGRYINREMTFEEIKRVLKNKTVGIAGAGGLGSNCAVSLVRVGLGNLIIADFDVVSESNLNRQYFFRDQIGMKKVVALQDNLLRINSGLKLTIFDERLNKSNRQTLGRDGLCRGAGTRLFQEAVRAFHRGTGYHISGCDLCRSRRLSGSSEYHRRRAW